MVGLEPELESDAAIIDAGYPVSRPFPSWNRSILTEIYLCHACSCQEILRAKTAGQGFQGGAALASAIFGSYNPGGKVRSERVLLLLLLLLLPAMTGLLCSAS
jgi:hypothetical protein